MIYFSWVTRWRSQEIVSTIHTSLLVWFSTMVLKFVVAIAMLLVAKLSPRCAFGVHTQRGVMSEGRFFWGCAVLQRYLPHSTANGQYLHGLFDSDWAEGGANSASWSICPTSCVRLSLKFSRQGLKSVIGSPSTIRLGLKSVSFFCVNSSCGLTLLPPCFQRSCGSSRQARL